VPHGQAKTDTGCHTVRPGGLSKCDC